VSAKDVVNVPDGLLDPSGTFPPYVKQVEAYLTDSFSTKDAYHVRAVTKSSRERNIYHVHVSRGRRYGLVVKLSSAASTPSKVALKVAPSSPVMRTFEVIAALTMAAVILVVFVGATIDHGELPPKKVFIGMVIVGALAGAVVYAIGWVTSRILMVSANNPFSRERLSVVQRAVKDALTEA